MTELQRFGSRLSGHQLHRMLTEGAAPTTFPLHVDLNLARIHDAVGQLPGEAGSDRLTATTDAVLAPVVHEVLKGLPRRTLLDIGFWQWLTCTEFREYVRRRWAPAVDLEAGESLLPSQESRFLGGTSLHGIARNALSRLFWVPEALQDGGEDYRLTRRLFSRQDLLTGLMERKFGLVTPVARAVAEHLTELPEDERRTALRRLNLRASTVALEGMSEPDVAKLLGVS